MQRRPVPAVRPEPASGGQLCRQFVSRWLPESRLGKGTNGPVSTQMSSFDVRVRRYVARSSREPQPTQIVEGPIGIAGYLTYVHYEGLKVVCLSSGGCETVQSSRYAKLDGIPVAVLGLAGYIAILLTLAIRGDSARAAGFGIALVGFLFSMYLTYRELFTIHAICQWCVGSAVLMSGLAILTGIRLMYGERHPPAPPPVERPPRPRSATATRTPQAAASESRRKAR